MKHIKINVEYNGVNEDSEETMCSHVRRHIIVSHYLKYMVIEDYKGTEEDYVILGIITMILSTNKTE